MQSPTAHMYSTNAEELKQRFWSSVGWKAGEGKRQCPHWWSGGLRAEKKGMKMSLLYFSSKLAN